MLSLSDHSINATSISSRFEHCWAESIEPAKRGGCPKEPSFSCVSESVFGKTLVLGRKPDWTIGSELVRRDTGNRVDQIFGLGTVIPAPGGFIRTGLEEWCSSQRSLWSSDKGHVGDVLASRGDEGRGRLRKAWGSCQTSI